LIIGSRHFSVADALHDQRHSGRRHQWSGDLIEDLVGIFLLGKGPLQEVDKRGHFQLMRQVARRGVAGDFIVFDLLSGTDQRLPIELNRLTPAAAGYGAGIYLGELTLEFHGCKVNPHRSSDDFEVA